MGIFEATSAVTALEGAVDAIEPIPDLEKDCHSENGRRLALFTGVESHDVPLGLVEEAAELILLRCALDEGLLVELDEMQQQHAAAAVAGSTATEDRISSSDISD